MICFMASLFFTFSLCIKLSKIFPDSSSSTFFFSSSWSSPLGDRHHWETSPRKISCQIFKGSIGNNQKLAQDQSNIQATFSKFPSKNQKKTLFSGENEHVIPVEISNLQKIGSTHIPFGTPGPATCRRAHGLKKVVASKKPSNKTVRVESWNPEKDRELWHRIQLAEIQLSKGSR